MSASDRRTRPFRQMDEVAATGILEEPSEEKPDFSSCMDDDERLEMVNWIAANKSSREHLYYLSRRVKGAGSWLLQNQRFIDWVEGAATELWCHGNAGTGKSVATSILIESLQKRVKPDPNALLLFVYFNFQEPQYRTLEYWKDLLQQTIRRRVRTETCAAMLRDAKATNAKLSLGQVRDAVIAELACYRQVYVVIDTLDEAPNDGASLLDTLRELAGRKQLLKLLVASRDDASIPDYVKGWTRMDVLPPSEVTAKSVEECANIQTSPIGSLLSHDERELVVQAVLNSANNNFLLATLNLQYLNAQVTKERILESLPSLPSTLSEAYDKAIHQINEQTPPARELAYRVFSWILHSSRPMSILELQYALTIASKGPRPSYSKDHLVTAGSILEVTRGLVLFWDDQVRFIHSSCHEHFHRRVDIEIPGPSFLAFTCLQYLSCGGWTSRFQYALQGWARHLPTDQKTADYNGVDLYELAERVLSDSTKADPLSRMTRGGKYKDESPLHICAFWGLDELVKRLLKNGHRTSAIDYRGRTPFYYAVKFGHLPVVKTLWEWDAAVQEEVDSPPLGTTLQRPPIVAAARKGHLEVVKFLVQDGGADLNNTDNLGRTILTSDAAPNWEVVEWALKFQSHILDLNAAADDGTTVLMLAASEGKLVYVRQLHEGCRGVDIEAKDDSGQTAFLLAAALGRPNVVAYLAETAGANVTTTDSAGASAVSVACAASDWATVSFLIARDEVDVEAAVNKRGETLLMVAAYRNQLEIVHQLVEKRRVSVETRSTAGLTALMFSAVHGHNEVARYLAGVVLRTDAGDEYSSALTLEGGDNDLMLFEEPIKNAALVASAYIERILYDTLHDLGDDGRVTSWREVYQKVGEDWVPDSVKTRHKKNQRPQAKEWAQKYAPVTVLLYPWVEPTLVKDWTPLMFAAAENHLATVKVLVEEEHSSIEEMDETGQTALRYAACQGNLEIVRYLIEEAGAHTSVDDHSGPKDLSYAMRQQQWCIVLYLLNQEHKFSPQEGERMLFFCATRALADSAEVIELLVGKGHVNPSARRAEDGAFALMLAATQGTLELVKYLCQVAPQDLYATGTNGFTPIWSAAHKNRWGVVLHLAGVMAEVSPASLCQPNKEGVTLLWYVAREHLWDEVLALVNIPEVGVEDLDSHGRTLLMHACYNGRLEVVKFLVEKRNQDVARTTSLGRTAAYYAALAGELEVLQYLAVQQQADLGVSDSQGCTILMAAVKTNPTNAPQVVRYLVEDAGVDLDALECTGKSAIDIANESCPSVVEYLRNHTH